MWNVAPNLYLGDREDSRDKPNLLRHKITHIVNCAAELPCCFEGEFSYLPLALLDPDPKFASCVAAANKFIDDGRRNGGVLVHCTGGVSRSAAVVLAYFCHGGTSIESASKELARRVLTGIDPSFLAQIAMIHGRQLAAPELESLSLALAGRG